MKSLRTLAALAIFADLVLLATAFYTAPCGLGNGFGMVVVLAVFTFGIPVLIAGTAAFAIASMLPHRARWVAVATPALFAAAVAVVNTTIAHDPSRTMCGMAI
jgi:hypothetical protein